MATPSDDEFARSFAGRIRAEAERIAVPDSWPALRARLEANAPTRRHRARTRPVLIAAGALAALLITALVMVPNLRGPGPVAIPSPAPAATSAPELNGRWLASWTRAELAASPLTGPGELNDGNWGTFSLVLDNGRGRETMWNSRTDYEFEVTYTTKGDVLTVDRDNGEHFVMRWRIDGDRLILTRDDNLGEVPVAYVIKPLVH